MEHPVLITTAIVVGVTAGVFSVCYWPRRGRTFDFDAGGKQGAFEDHAKRYQDLAKLVITLSTASVAFLVNFLVGLTTDKSNRGPYSLRLEEVSPWVITFLGLSTVSLLFFILFENMYYEDYVHSKYTESPEASRETYTAKKYAAVLTMAWTGLLWFLVAYGFVAIGLLRKS